MNKNIEVDFIDDKHGKRFVVWVDGEIKKIFKNKTSADKFVAHLSK